MKYPIHLGVVPLPHHQAVEPPLFLTLLLEVPHYSRPIIVVKRQQWVEVFEGVDLLQQVVPRQELRSGCLPSVTGGKTASILFIPPPEYFGAEISGHYCLSQEKYAELSVASSRFRRSILGHGPRFRPI